MGAYVGSCAERSGQCVCGLVMCNATDTERRWSWQPGGAMGRALNDLGNAYVAAGDGLRH